MDDPEVEAIADLETVARAYRAAREAGQSDLASRHAADAAYRRRNPGTPDSLQTRRVVDTLIAVASRRGMLWPMPPGWKGGKT